MQFIKKVAINFAMKKVQSMIAELIQDEKGAPSLAGQIGMAVLVVVIILALLAIFNPGFQGIANSILQKIQSMS